MFQANTELDRSVSKKLSFLKIISNIAVKQISHFKTLKVVSNYYFWILHFMSTNEAKLKLARCKSIPYKTVWRYLLVKNQLAAPRDKGQSLNVKALCETSLCIYMHFEQFDFSVENTIYITTMGLRHQKIPHVLKISGSS